jgi:hypothetical protein
MSVLKLLALICQGGDVRAFLLGGSSPVLSWLAFRSAAIDRAEQVFAQGRELVWRKHPVHFAPESRSGLLSAWRERPSLDDQWVAIDHSFFEVIAGD